MSDEIRFLNGYTGNETISLVRKNESNLLAVFEAAGMVGRLTKGGDGPRIELFVNDDAGYDFRYLSTTHIGGDTLKNCHVHWKRDLNIVDDQKLIDFIKEHVPHWIKAKQAESKRRLNEVEHLERLDKILKETTVVE